ncbi:MAG: D-beta-D-heptose 7-phosphate kinase/D-beta-D-heptose 1-phosphate adenosyltransferase [Planctomycetota bacterium]|jgi:D-beta-D-heptose 7-phosphate kinase/D-beta-D-heptose 1-phosphate adenosyltransferase
MNERELLGVLEGMSHPRVLIVGDLILDRYVSGDVSRISPEAPIPVLRARRAEDRLGGAANVAANLRAMEAEVEVIGLVGEDVRGKRLVELLTGIGVDVSRTITATDRPTTQKTRMMSGANQMLRIDWEEGHELSPEHEQQTLRALGEGVPKAQAVLLSDYGKGMLTPAVIARAIELARAAGIPVLVDPKGTDYRRYSGATLVTPNRKEAEQALGRRFESLAEVPAGADELMALANLDAAVITLGSDGIFFRDQNGLEGRVPALARQVFDVTGAGDTVISHLTLGLAAGIGLEPSVQLANLAASLVVARRGAASVTRSELEVALGQRRGGRGGILRRQDLPGALAEWRAGGKRIVFTNGCFDILHAGHITYLTDARSRGDILIVAVNDDESVRRMEKAPGRPINVLEDRLTVLAALDVVDAVVAFNEDTPGAIIEEITPDVLVKGQDWEHKGIVGREWVESHGGEVYLAPIVPGRSTTSIAERIVAAHAARPS